MAGEDVKTEKWENKKVTSRAEDFSQWYLDVIAAADLAEHAPVRGCMTIKPNGYAIWENIQKILDLEFKKLEIKNAYFPLLIPEKFLKKETQHVEGFAPEVAVVTYAGGKKLEEPYVIRPTSETIINEAFSRWIQSHRDLPMLVNQWANIVRWELRPRLFLRTTEFLWQEGHTAHATQEGADLFARQMLGVYKKFSEEVLAIPVLAGAKSDMEKFAGADKTYAIEAMMQDGKALQLATSHNLGQNFAKAFEIQFVNENNTSQYVWQTSWGMTTRTIGSLIMVHGDDTGLVLPPRIAPLKVVVVPIWKDDKDKETMIKHAQELADRIKKDESLTVQVDKNDARPGEKYFVWERQGIPIRIELGPKDIVENSAIVVRRDTGAKEKVKLDKITEKINATLVSIQENLFARALEYRNNNIKEVADWDGFKKAIETGSFVLTYWCGESEVELKIKEETGATIRCIPLEDSESEGKCVYSGRPSKIKVIFAKAY